MDTIVVGQFGYTIFKLWSLFAFGLFVKKASSVHGITQTTMSLLYTLEYVAVFSLWFHFVYYYY